jgi:hypothetical protein
MVTRQAQRKLSARAGAVLTVSTAALVLIASGTAHGDITVSPAVELRQVASDNSIDGRGWRGWLEAAASVGLELDTNRTDISAYYRAAYRVPEFGNVSDRWRHNGNLNLRTEVIEDLFFLDAGALASQFSADARGFQTINADLETGNQTQVLSGWVQPSIVQRLGNFADFNARYRLGGTTADGPNTGLGGFGGQLGLDPGDALSSILTDSVSQSGTLQLSSQPGTNTISWTLTGDAVREDIDQLNQKYRTYRGIADAGLRVSRSVTLVGSVGYEDINNTQDSILFDPVTGRPVLLNGELQIDPAMPRRTAFAFKGMTFDGGIRLTPSRRTSLEVRAGRKFGQFALSGDLRFVSRGGVHVEGSWNEDLNSFGRLLTQFVDGVPFNVRRVGGFDQFGVPPCVIAIDPASPGECLLGLTQSVTPATFRSERGVLNIFREEDAWRWRVSAFYDKRAYVDVQQLQVPGVPLPPGDQLGPDETFGVRGGVNLNLGERETIGLNALVSRSSFALTQNRHDTGILGGVNYSRRLNDSLNVSGSLYGGYRFSDSARNSGNITASVGVGYRF